MSNLPPMLRTINENCPRYNEAVSIGALDSRAAVSVPLYWKGDDKPSETYCNGRGWLWKYGDTGIPIMALGMCEHCLPLLEAGQYTDGDRIVRTFGSFEVKSKGAEKIKGAVVQFAGAYELQEKPKMGLVLTGPVGSGKSHLLSALYSHFQVHLRPFVAEWIPINRLYQAATSFHTTAYELAEERLIAGDLLAVLQTTPYLFLDGVGDEKKEDVLLHRQVVDELRGIIQMRYDRRLPLFLSTNWKWKPEKPNAADADETLLVYGEREADRLWETCQHVCVNLPSYRAEIEKQRSA